MGEMPMLVQDSTQAIEQSEYETFVNFGFQSPLMRCSVGTTKATKAGSPRLRRRLQTSFGFRKVQSAVCDDIDVHTNPTCAFLRGARLWRQLGAAERRAPFLRGHEPFLLPDILASNLSNETSLLVWGVTRVPNAAFFVCVVLASWKSHPNLIECRHEKHKQR